MPMLTVRCAKCNAVIPTGTEMSYETFRNATFTQRTVECPRCENVQTWTTDDVDRSVFKEKT
jgi:phage FluMu protein Com